MRVLPHEEIIAKLDRAGELFRVLIVKTNMRIPYTSVFFELDCGYWNAQAEKKPSGGNENWGSPPEGPKA